MSETEEPDAGTRQRWYMDSIEETHLVASSADGSRNEVWGEAGDGAQSEKFTPA